jgi:hypothetical protein
MLYAVHARGVAACEFELAWVGSRRGVGFAREWTNSRRGCERERVEQREESDTYLLLLMEPTWRRGERG